ncbi:universal stress protein [Halanaeroarchaeum sulfurireducens]|uniref:UspA domain-containing protein n=1 Tax=Halanaeroarchaeum sulfurireducens TaxID=1604004 RepID=A0A0F7PCH3_9EURY|nr:universal stress protein [Halanaeroarchaeum sulfurireducens]AKH97063.1 UspA domain-containing protein [Halanaeroarchaeum sulfurireducens]ALG81464.1 UspA domain-containing protein [Halanaeroarchaeum sulfurireducens]
MYDTILVPTDGSPESLTAVDEAADLASALDADLVALYVVDTRDYATLPETKWVTLAEELEQAGERALAKVEKRADEHDVPVSTTVVRGVPHESILEYADEAGADAIVMSTHGRTGIDRFLLGSVTERVIRSADLPIVVVGAGED